MSSSWQKFYQEINKTVTISRNKGQVLWFRGQRLSEWPLKSSLHRWVEENVKQTKQAWADEEKGQLLNGIAKLIHYRFQARGWPLLTEKEKSDWGLVFSQQHYGLPTRLLDWSESFLCALYFAQLNRLPNEEAAVFILKPELLNERNWGNRGLVALEMKPGPNPVQSDYYHPNFKFEKPDLPTICVLPVYTNHRMRAQQSVFTLCGDSFDPIEEQYPQEIFKVVLPPETYDDVNEYLELTGVGPFTFFPDLEGLRNQIVNELLLDRNLSAKKFGNLGDSEVEDLL